MSIRPLFALLAFATVAGAQNAPSKPIPIRQVSAPLGVSKELIKYPAGVVQLRDGGVLVNDFLGKRLVRFAPDLASFTVTADSVSTGAAHYPYSNFGAQLMYWVGDSVAFTDRTNDTFTIIGPDGKLGRAMAHAKQSDMRAFNNTYAGSPAFDSRGRFVYRALGGGGNPFARPATGANAPPPRTRDTSALVRADFETRTVDTIATIVLPFSRVDPLVRDDKGNPSIKRVINPVPYSPPQWMVLSGGDVAIVDPHDYHIDWVGLDGTKRSTPKMPFDWRRLTDEDKQKKIDSMKKMIDSVNASGKIYGMTIAGRPGSPKPDTIAPTIEFVPYSEMEDYVPAVRGGSVTADRDNHLWILPTTTLSAVGGGILYDVVNTNGEIVERVQLPAGRAIAGFGSGGIVYLMIGDRDKGFTIEKRKVVR